MPVRPKTQQPAAATVNIGTLGTYTGGFSLPEGDYAIEFTVRNGNPNSTNQTNNTRLGVLAEFYPLKGGEPIPQFISMGSKAEQSFAPDPNTGKGVVAIPGGAGGSLNNKTNWFYFLKSLYDAGMPEGVFSNDFTAIDGIHVHARSIPEPEERKAFGAKTGEAAQEERTGSGMMPSVTEILESGKPWEGTGGIPDGTAAPVAQTKVAGKIAPKAPAAAPVAAPAAAEGDEDVLAAAGNGMSAVLGKLKAGETISLLKLKTSTFREVNASAGGEMGQRVQTEVFGNSDVTGNVLGELGYKLEGGIVKEAQ